MTSSESYEYEVEFNPKFARTICESLSASGTIGTNGGGGMLRISACVITKDEERNLGRWLESMRGLADEMIVVDTGSADGTVALARSAGASVFSFAWQDDFAAAKNYALEQAGGDWILFLDADEFFADDAKRELRQFLESIHPQREIYGLLSPLYNIDVDEGNRILSRMEQLRIFRGERELRYTGRVHEDLVHPVGRRSLRTEFAIYHTGYSTHIVKQKAERNLAILQNEMKQGRSETALAAYLADCCATLEQHEQTIRYARMALGATDGVPGQHVKLYRRIYDAMFHLKRPDGERERLLDEALAEFPEYPDFLCQKGFQAYYAGEYAKAEDYLLRTLGAMEQPAYQQDAREESAMEYAMPRVCVLLGELAARKGDAETALAYAEQALALHCYEEDAVLLLCRTQREPLAQIAELGKYFSPEREADRTFLRKALDKLPLNETYLYFVRPEPGSYASLMAAGEYEAAARRALAILRAAEKQDAERCLLWKEKFQAALARLDDGAREGILREVL